MLVHNSGLLSRVDNLIFDIGQKLQQSPAPDDVIIVAIDENSLSQLGRWPWPRTTHAKLINRLQQEHAAAIGLDIVFAEADQPMRIKPWRPPLRKPTMSFYLCC